MFARDIKYIKDQRTLITDTGAMKEMRQNILDGDIFVAKNVYAKEIVLKIREYLSNIGRYSLPNYMPIEAGVPNSHRVSVWDERSYVKTCFHQFSFYPWNQDIFNLFKLSSEVFAVKNLLGNNPVDKFMKAIPEDGCTARLAFQFYPKGIGAMNKHKDPFDHHQSTVPMLTMSKKGVDFKIGGSYVEKSNGDIIYLDEVSELGDVIYFNPQTPHGVECIDSGTKEDWLSFEGRWTLLFAVNKVSGNKDINNSEELTK
jgi:hypothetical protein